MGTIDAPICPYCNKRSKLVTGAEVYPHLPHLHKNPIYQCQPCDAYVGCHPGTTKPLGRLADLSLRRWKMRAHAAFDPIWQERLERRRLVDQMYNKGMARGGRYKRLAELLGIPKDQCHIGLFDVELCQRTVMICNSGQLSVE